MRSRPIRALRSAIANQRARICFAKTILYRGERAAQQPYDRSAVVMTARGKKKEAGPFLAANARARGRGEVGDGAATRGGFGLRETAFLLKPS